MTMQPVTRRTTLRGFAFAGVAVVAGFVVARTHKSDKGQTTAANGYGAAPATGGKQLARLDQVPANGGVIVSGDKVVLTRGSDDTVHGFSAICTHQGCTVGSVSGGAIECPCHGSRFDTQTGAVVTGPATEPLPKVAVVVRDGAVFTE